MRPFSALLGLCGVLGRLAPVYRCARVVCRVACAVSGAFDPCSPVRPLGVLCCVSAVLGHLAPVHRCVRLVCCFVSAVCRAILLLFTGVPGRGVPSLCCRWCLCVRGVLAKVAPVHRRARCVQCACAVGGCVSLPPPIIFFSFFLPSRLFFFVGKKRQNNFFYIYFTKKGARVHCRHKHGQLVQWCSSVVFSGVCHWCFGGRAPGVRLPRPDVHGYASGLVLLGASLPWVLAG